MGVLILVFTGPPSYEDIQPAGLRAKDRVGAQPRSLVTHHNVLQPDYSLTRGREWNRCHPCSSDDHH